MSSTLPKLIRLLASDNPFEVFAAAQAMQRVLRSSGKDLNDFADALEGGGRPPEPRKNAPPPPPTNTEMAEVGCIDKQSGIFLARLNKNLSVLTAREREFIKGLVERYSKWGNKMFLSEKQESWLRSMAESYGVAG